MRLMTVAAAFFALLLAGGCRRGGEENLNKEEYREVRVYKAELIKSVESEKVPGTFRAKLAATIEAKIPGRVENMPVSEGQTVEEGQLLAQLDMREVQARLDQAIALRDQADRDLKRFRALLQQKAATQAEYDGVEAKARVARASVVEAQTMLSYAQVKAPFRGVVTKKRADVGDLASPGRPLIELEDSSALRFEASVPETFIGLIEPGEILGVTIPALGKALNGVVSEISPTADPNSRTFLVKADVPAVPGLRSGQYGHVAVPVEHADIITVPAGSVIRRGQMEIVFVAKDGRVWLRLVRTGRKVGEHVELLSGLDPGETIVLDNVSALRDGENVKVI